MMVFFFVLKYITSSISAIYGLWALKYSLNICGYDLKLIKPTILFFAEKCVQKNKIKAF